MSGVGAKASRLPGAISGGIPTGDAADRTTVLVGHLAVHTAVINPATA